MNSDLLCKFRGEGVTCTDITKCEDCGWNPEVEKKRKEERGQPKADPKPEPEPAEKQHHHTDEEVERLILELHRDFGGEMALTAIAQEHHVTLRRLRKIRRRILQNLKNSVVI